MSYQRNHIHASLVIVIYNDHIITEFTPVSFTTLLNAKKKCVIINNNDFIFMRENLFLLCFYAVLIFTGQL